VNKIIVGEQKHFELRRGARAGQKDQLRERLNQMQEQIHGLNKQVDAKQREIKLVFKELEGLRGLWAKRLVTISKLTHVEREAARLEGELGELIASTAEAKGKVAEIGLQIIQVDHELRSQVAEELSDVRAKLAELAERKIAAEDQLKRVDIRATQTGTVHELTVHTIGGVVAPGDPIMLIVPDSDSLVVEARVQPADIDQLSTGQVAALRFSAFNQRVTPEVSGRVTRIAPDVTQDQSSGETYYLVRVAIDRDAAEKLQNVSLVPGMPVEVFLQTGPRSALSYLLKPLQDQVARAFRDT